MRPMRIIGLATFSVLTAGVAAFGQAGPQKVGWRELAAHPERYLGKRIELSAAYCSSDEKGAFDCSTDGPVHVAPAALAPARARQKVETDCGGLDTIERSRSCRARIRFTPTSIRRDTDVAGKRVLVLAADEAELSF